MPTIQEEQKRQQDPAAAPQEAAPQTVQPAGSGTGAAAYKSPLGGDTPMYNPSYDGEIAGIIDQINNRGDFKFNLNESDIYNTYRDKAIRNGQMAMRDTMGQAAGLTGGYGSSYAQSAGQQAYGRYLESLNDIVPELEQNAYARWQAEGDDLKDRYQILEGEREREYGEYKDEVNRYLTERQLLAQEDAATYARERDAAEDARYADEQAYKRGQQSYSQMVSLIASSGYMPTAEELSAAGMTQAQAEALRNEYLRSTGQLEAAPKAVSYAGGGNRKNLTAEDVLAELIGDLTPVRPGEKSDEDKKTEQTPKKPGRGAARSTANYDR